MRELRWASEEGDGIEHLVFDARDDGFAVESVVVGQRYGKAYGLHYAVRCDARWRTRYARLKIVGGGELELHADGQRCLRLRERRARRGVRRRMRRSQRRPAGLANDALEDHFRRVVAAVDRERLVRVLTRARPRLLRDAGLRGL